jgi:GDPmannose 4,6-dehydratase
MKKALIIGVSGQDGAYLAKLLLEKGYEVYGTSRDHEVSSFANLVTLGIRDRVKTMSMVTSDFRSVLTALQSAEADEVYNLAGQTSVGMSFDYPVETFDSILIGTMNLLECLRLLRHPVRFYNAGSSEVFGNTQKPATETTPFHPRSPYAAAKAAAHYSVTNYREAYGLFACTGILFNHESPLRPARFVTQKIVSTAVRIGNGSKEKLVLGRLDIRRDWGWAPEYVEAMWRMLQQKKPDDYVVATGEEHSLQQFVAETFRQLGLDWRKHVVSDSKLFRPSDIDRSRGNASKARRKLGFKSKSGLNKIISLLIGSKKNSEQYAHGKKAIRTDGLKRRRINNQ